MQHNGRLIKLGSSYTGRLASVWEYVLLLLQQSSCLAESLRRLTARAAANWHRLNGLWVRAGNAVCSLATPLLGGGCR